MSKIVKNMVAEDIKRRLHNVNDALLVNVIGLTANANYTLRKELRAKKINVLVVKNSMAARATEGTSLARLFDGVGGAAAICWGAEDIVALAKSITEILKADKFPALQPRGGVMDGEQISADQIAEVAKWPSRAEQLSLVLGQILSTGSRLNGQLMSVGGALASQIAQRAEGGEEAADSTEAAASTEAAGSPQAAMVSEGGHVEGAAPAAAATPPSDAPAAAPAATPAEGSPAA